MSTFLSKAIEIAGYAGIGRACKVTPAAVRKWEQKGLPRTEWTGETAYAAAIARCVKNKVTKRQLLSERAGASRAPNGASAERAVAGQGGECMDAVCGADAATATRASGVEVSCQS